MCDQIDGNTTAENNHLNDEAEKEKKCNQFETDISFYTEAIKEAATGIKAYIEEYKENTCFDFTETAKEIIAEVSEL